MLVTLVVAALALLAQPATAEDKPTTTRTYQVPAAELFVTVAQIAAQRWNVTHSDKDVRTVSFKTGANMRTFKGFEVSVVCIALADGSTQVSLHPQKRPSGQLFAWKEGDRIAKTFFQALDERLAEIGVTP